MILLNISNIIRLNGYKITTLPTRIYSSNAFLKPKLNLKQFTRNAILGTPLTGSLTRNQQKLVGGWLLGCAGLTFGAVVLGGVTRLTESGLSMVDWHLIKGMKPPINEEEWIKSFDNYKQYPEFEFKSIDHEMTLNEFKFIFTMEYLHRMWGRGIGLAFLLPASYFWVRGWFTSPMKKRVVFGGTLLLFQGLLGWYMVKSGLNPKQNSNPDIPRVSQYRLAAHLSSALVFYTVNLWCGLSFILTPINQNNLKGIGKLRGMAHFSKTAIFLTAISGAFVAGLDAGLTYNSWPKFADRWIPSDLFSMSPIYKNITENPTTVQFVHRSLAYISLAAVTTTWFVGKRIPLHARSKLALNSLCLLIYGQASLGILTLINYVPVWLAALHQSGSLIVLSSAFWLTNEIRRFPVK